MQGNRYQHLRQRLPGIHIEQPFGQQAGQHAPGLQPAPVFERTDQGAGRFLPGQAHAGPVDGMTARQAGSTAVSSQRRQRQWTPAADTGPGDSRQLLPALLAQIEFTAAGAAADDAGRRQ